MFKHLVLFVVLTVLTQIGGIVYLLSVGCKKRFPSKWGALYFPSLYLLFWCFLPLLAAPFGRVPLPYRASKNKPLQAQHIFTVLANRHYVQPVLREEILAVARQFEEQYPETPLTYLDANFPFWNGFPLLPHLSHNDGRKLDLSYIYRHQGKRTSYAPSFLGYGRCALPQDTEQDKAADCAAQGYWQYSLLRNIGAPFQGINYSIDQTATAKMVKLLAQRKHIGKLLLEPHLKQRWQLGRYHKIRFQGCRAVRHDDHLHVQL